MAFDTDAIIDRVKREAARRLLAAALALRSAHRAAVSTGNPAPHDSPAPKGDYPRLRTGGGRAGVSVSPATLGEIAAGGSVAVGHRPAGKHLYFLAGTGWKGLTDTLAAERPKIDAILKGS